jgi:alpha-galactosidase
VSVAELTVHAALEERRDLVYQAALLDPNTAATLTTSEIVALCDDMLDGHGDLIPRGMRS